MVRKKDRPTPKKPGVNLGPFSDVTTSLVIMFMLTIPFLIESGIYISRSLPSRLNIPQQITPQKSDIKVNIHLKADGTILLNEEPVDPSILPDLIPKLLARSVKKQALLSADEEVIYENVIQIIDLVKEKGASDVLIMKRKKGG